MRKSLPVLLLLAAVLGACASTQPTALRAPSGPHLYGLRFDPHGADFTVWVNDFKNQIYRNWIIPQAGYLGNSDIHFRFTVERDGSLSWLRILKSTDTESLDRAAWNALSNSRFLALPDDYGPDERITMQVVFQYGPER